MSNYWDEPVYADVEREAQADREADLDKERF
jgi:hypothetical protein